MNDLECPYCGVGANVCHDDGDFYEEDCLHEMECPFCENTYTFTTMITFSYETQKADCLNGGDHIWKHTTTIPIEFTQMRCSLCEETREPTLEEWRLIKSEYTA